MEGESIKINSTRVGVGVLVVRQGMFLLGKRCGKHMPGYFAAPGGHLEPGETFVECAVREVMEETGLLISNVQFLMLGNYKFGDKQYVDIDMVAESISGEPVVKEIEKISQWQWYHFEDLPSPLFIVTERMIHAYRHGYHADDSSIARILEQ